MTDTSPPGGCGAGVGPTTTNQREGVDVTSAQGWSAAFVGGVAVVVLGGQLPVPTLHDLRDTPKLEINSNIRAKKVIGEIGTFMVGDFSAGFKSAPHHHTYEQINIGLTGSFTPVEATTSARRFALGPGVVLVNPPGAPPLQIRRQGREPATLLIFEARQ